MSSVQEDPQVAPEKEKTEEEVDPTQGLSEALSKFEGAPDKNQIEAWKQEYGEVLCSGFSDNELLIWRPLSRQEFVDMQTKLAQGGTQLDQEQMVVESCVLWLSDDAKKSMQTKAGSFSTLHEQIMYNSNFIDPRIASALVIKL